MNGGWLDANPVPPEYGSWGAFHEVNQRNEDLLHELCERAAENAEGAGASAAERMVGDYYAAAMDEERIAAAGVAPLGQLLAHIDAARSLDDVRAVLVELQHVGVGPFHSFGVESDFEDASAYMVYVGQGGLGLPERDYYTRDDERSVALREAYVGHVARQLTNLDAAMAASSGIATDVETGPQATHPDPDATDHAQEAAQAILGLETRLAEASYTAEQMRDVQLTLNRRDVSSLDDLMPGLGLARYVVELGCTLPTVNVDNPAFFSALDTTLSQTPIETLRDYLRWNLVRGYASSLPPVFENEAFEFYGRTLGGQQEMRPRWKRVLSAATGDIGEQVAQLYVDAAFSEDAKRRCEQMVDHLLSAMGRAIRSAEWMTEPTKEAALQKLASFGYKIGFPDVWRDYSKLVIDRESFVGNRMRAAAFDYDRDMGRIEQPVDKTEWAMPAHMVNAYYHPLLNEVVFPAGILQPPFFYADADDAVNFGAICAVIGHEITHGFDDQGSHFDANGSLKEWWTEADRAEFDRRASVLVEQFDAYQVFDDLHVNGRLTLGENIADLGGLTIALDALREVLEAGDASAREPIDGMTPYQRFFASYATVWRMNYTDDYLRLLVNVDPHSPTHFRANAPLTNLPAFAEAFGIAEGSPMARPAQERAKVW